MSYRRRPLPRGRATSKAQYRYFQGWLDTCDRHDTALQNALIGALKVDYHSLPERAGSLPPPVATGRRQGRGHCEGSTGDHGRQTTM
jgi:ferric-dicitrate binding protein FerR (iron transport regulator)